MDVIIIRWRHAACNDGHDPICFSSLALPETCLTGANRSSDIFYVLFFILHSIKKGKRLCDAGLDIGYVPAGSYAFLRLSGQFGPPQFIFHWAEGPVVFFLFFFIVLRMPPLFLLGIGKTRKATLIRTYFSLYIGLMYKSVQLHA